MAFGAGPTFITFLALLFNNIIIYLHVRRQLRGEGLTASQALQARDISERRRVQTREVAMQGFLYVVTFAISYTPAFVVRAIEGFNDEKVDDASIYALVVIQMITLPLQGFFNMFVYNRPRYVRVRAAYPEMTALQLLQKTCFDADIPKLTEISSRTSFRSNNSTKRRNNLSSSGKMFSSNLQILAEGSEEDKSESDASSIGRREHDTTEENTLSERDATERGHLEDNNVSPTSRLATVNDDGEDFDCGRSDSDDSLDMNEEFRKVFKEEAERARGMQSSTTSLKQIFMDGSIGSLG